MNHTDTIDIHVILDNIVDGFLILDKEWNIKWCNKAFENIVGSHIVKANDGNFRKMGQSIEGLDIIGQIKDSAETGERQQMEVYLRQTKTWYALNIYCSADNVVICFHDITCNKAHTEDVLIDEQNLRILMDIIDQPVWLVDRDCNILLCNEAFKRWIAYFIGVPLAKGDNVLDIKLGPDYLNKFKMCYELALNGKTFNTVEDLMVNGEMKFSTISFNPVFDKDNKLTGISCHASDITDQRKSLTRIDAQTQLLMEIANIQSHKVRGPVTTIMGLVKVFDFEDPANPENMEVLQGIASVTDSLDMIVRDVIRNINKLNKLNKHTRKW